MCTEQTEAYQSPYQQPASNTTSNSKGSDMNKSIENSSSGKIDQIARKYLKDSDNDTIRQALKVVTTDRNVSVSHLQRQLRVGYNRAVEVIEVLEERGIIGPGDDASQRKILILDELNTKASSETNMN